MEDNPYQPPLAYSVAPKPRASELLRAPALGVLVLAAMMAAGCVFALGPMFVLNPRTTPQQQRREAYQTAIFGMLLLGPNLIMAYGAYRARRGDSYRWALAAAILASIPILTPLLWIGIPFGIWMLIVLLRKDVRNCFAAHNT